ncbi:2-oxo acid dehydrogenase subunit E2 [Streptomyces arenae]|uniref:2-oxo acid dehydrogenase subunit E2 n=1 Tax=Streptomyces arenae TaxID=29301 RepID=UPI00265A6518|nr:2-oxo acid dehydrogenase subunit E2 [Streptomyces arenae]MCG7204950.1 2-oxo acid dehydrogenase subunit E2 [Streptomyces arenae]
MIDVELPKLNNNDTSYVLVEWLVDDGTEVTTGQPLVVIETSKAQEEIESPGEGVLHSLVKPGQDCRPGQVIAHVFASAEERAEFVRNGEASADAAEHDQPPASGLLITKDAQALVDEHGLSEDVLRGVGRKVIRRTDVEALLARGEPTDTAEARELPQWQRAVGAVVSESMRTIPAAAAYVRVDVDEALALGRQVSDRGGTPFGLPELLVAAVARRHAGHPLFFARLLDDGNVHIPPTADVGVTMDLGKGLFVPVVRDAAAVGAERLGELLMEYRIKALRGAFRASELTDANIMVALHNTEGVVLATPIVFPGQTCVVSLGGTEERLVLDGEGRPVASRYVHIGLVYDHRVVNGRDAMAFLQALKADLESPTVLDVAAG